MLVDYHVHALGHRGGDYSEELLREYLSVARDKGIEEIGFAEHDDYRDGLDPEAIAAAVGRFPSLQVRLGLEISYRPEREMEIREITKDNYFDYLIGSIHHIGEWMFDHPRYASGYANRDISELYRTYFSLVERMALSGLFDVVGHLDLVKVFDIRPADGVLSYARGALMAIASTGMVVEVNTAGLFKPCKEIYPAKELLERCYSMDIPVTLGSDAHEPEQVGREFGYAREILYQVGYRKLVRLVKRHQVYEYL